MLCLGSSVEDMMEFVCLGSSVKTSPVTCHNLCMYVCCTYVCLFVYMYVSL